MVSNDTLVENPAVINYVGKQLSKIKKAGRSKLFRHKPDLFKVRRLKPTIEDSFWVNLIGKGYPSPNRWFRWCTERIKINPTSRYISKTLSRAGEVIIVLGTRKAESANRAASMSKYGDGKKLRKHVLPNAYVYAPIAELSNDDVWAYLLQAPNPWGTDNKKLLALYKTACTDGECPMVVETGTASCGRSRFGCWVCTVVDKDKAMENFIDNGEEWMEDLLTFRNWLYDIRQANYQYIPNRLSQKAKFGPFLISTRREILKRLVEIQERLSEHLKTDLISEKERRYLDGLLKREAASENADGLKRFEFILANGRRCAAIADFNVLDTPRKRIGPLFLKGAKLKNTREVTNKYSRSTRVMYYEV